MEEKELSRTYNEELGRILESLGLPLWGITEARELKKYQAWFDRRPRETVSVFESREQHRRCHREGFFLSVVFPYAHDLTWTPAHFSVYARSRDYHSVAGWYLDQIADEIRKIGYPAEAYCDSNDLPERLIATLAGLGQPGRNGTFITEQYGSYVFLGEIRTDLPLTPVKEHREPDGLDLCGDCTLCIQACPARVLGPVYIKTNDCISSLTQQKELTPRQMDLLSGRLFGCDTCQRVCPRNRDKAGLGMKEFRPLPFMEDPDLSELLTLTNKTFMDRYRATAAGWRGKTVLARNAMIALKEADALPEGLSFASPLLTETCSILERKKTKNE